MRIAVLGGSFNPIHIGHLALADEVCSLLGYDRLLFVPTYLPPHKNVSDVVSAEDRLEMVRLACCSDSRFEAESCEIDRKGVSYTFDTINFLEDKYKDVLEGKIGLIMGDDLIPGFHLWYKAQELSRKCDIILANRPESSSSSSHSNTPTGQYAAVADSTGTEENLKKIMEDPLFHSAKKIDNIRLSISSTEIRERCSSGRSFKYLVPDEVFNYINSKNIYKS